MPKGQCHAYTPEQLNYLEENKTLNRKVLTENFNNKFETALTKVAINALCKRKGWLTGRTGHYAAGEKSWNAGTKGATTRNKTTFSKGNVPANLKPIGHERICSKDGIIFIKVAEPNPYTKAQTRYRPKHHVVWETRNGPIKPGMVIRFIDHDKLNCDIGNLEMITKSLNLRLNKMDYANLPTEIKPTAKLYAQLEVATFNAVKNG